MFVRLFARSFVCSSCSSYRCFCRARMMCDMVCPDTRTLKTMLEGDSSLRSRVVRFLMECDEAVAMRKDGHLNPLFAHSSVRVTDRPAGGGFYRSTDGFGRPTNYQPIEYPTARPITLPTDRIVFLCRPIGLANRSTNHLADRPIVFPIFTD